MFQKCFTTYSRQGASPAWSLLIFFCTALNANAQSPIAVSDSEVLYQTALEPGTQWILAEIKKSAGPMHLSSIAANEGAFETRIYLPDGPGAYEITILRSDDPSPSSAWRHSIPLEHFTARNSDTRDLEYLLPSLQIQSDTDVVQRLAENTAAHSTNRMDKVGDIHDFVVRNIRFDLVSYEAFEQSGEYFRNFDALEVLSKKSGICFGYSNLTAALLRSLGIPTRVVDGIYAANGDFDAVSAGEKCPHGNHAWNEALIDGEWIPLDTTYDAVSLDSAHGQISSKQRLHLQSAREFNKTHLKCRDAIDN